MIINSLAKSLITEFGMSFCYYQLKKYGPRLISKIDRALLEVLEAVVIEGKEYQYYCQECETIMPLFENEDVSKEFAKFKTCCENCDSKNIHLKTIKIKKEM